MDEGVRHTGRWLPLVTAVAAIALLAGFGYWYWNMRLGGGAPASTETTPPAIPDYLDHVSTGGFSFTYRTSDLAGHRVLVAESTTAIRTVVQIYAEGDRSHPIELHSYRRFPRMTTPEYLAALVRNTNGAEECPVDGIAQDPVDPRVFRIRDTSDGTARCPFFDGEFLQFAGSPRVLFIGARDEPLWSEEDHRAWRESIALTE